MLASHHEKRPLKKPKLGPPDIYPQGLGQREDELTPSNLKHGFSTLPQLGEEHGTVHSTPINAGKVGSFFNAIVMKKEELNTIQDSSRKKQQTSKDHFWPVSPRNKVALDKWFTDLARNQPLLQLAKKAPSFNKKEETFAILCDNQVSMQRATWFIKLSSAYTSMVTEAKNKKRYIYDPAPEWTGNLIKFMKDLLPKLQEYYNPVEKSSSTPSASAPPPNPVPHQLTTSSMTPSSLSSPNPLHSPGNNSAGQQQSNVLSVGLEDSKNSLKYWNYCTQLAKYMYEESLLDRQEFLNWILELLDKVRSQPCEDGLQKLILTFTLQYMKDFVMSEKMSRRLAYIVAKKLSNILNSVIENKENQGVNVKGEPMETDQTEDVKEKSVFKAPLANDPFENVLNDLLSCPQHRDIIMFLSSILQVITIECPTAMVWCGIGDNRTSGALTGSPLDHLSIPPSSLPMSARCHITNAEVKRQLLEAEEEIIMRSHHAENKWCAEKWKNVSKNTYSNILYILDALDSHDFNKVDLPKEGNNCIEKLYSKIFPEPKVDPNAENKENIKPEYDPKQDASTVKILCEWAVSYQRWGEHRPMAVAWLLDKRQMDVTATPEDNANNNNDDKDSVNSGGGCGLIGGLPVFQSVLMDFLDHDAPVLDENGTTQNRTQFTNLVHLFSELIRHDVFSYNAYLCTLISRGDANFKESLGTGPISNKGASPNQTQTNIGGPTNCFDDEPFTAGIDIKHSITEFDDSNVDEDLDKLLQNIKEKDQGIDAPNSPDPDHVSYSRVENQTSSVSRHYVYTKHFPIYQDDPSAISFCSESNQRYILLFGVGKERDEKKHAVKKMSKEICKLFSKKFSIDVAEGGKVKKHSRSEFNFESTTTKCQNMPYFDQHVVTYQCASTVLEMLSSFSSGTNNYLPVQEHVAFLFDLMEMALNIFGLLDMCIQILKELPEVEVQLLTKKSNLAKNYTLTMNLYLVGIFRRYHSCLLVSPDQVVSIFEGLYRMVKHVTNPSDCSSAERCILAYLYDLYLSSQSLVPKSKIQNIDFQKINTALSLQQQPIPPVPNPIPQIYPQFLTDILRSPRRGGKIDMAFGRQLNDPTNQNNQFSFVCNAFVAISRESNNDRLNDIAITCAELTASCNTLSAEWIAALETLCVPNLKEISRYQELLNQIDIKNYTLHNRLAVLTCILVARHCFTLETFVYRIALRALGNVYSGKEMTQHSEAMARLSCHLLLKLFQSIEIPQPGLYTVSTSPNPVNITMSNISNIELSCDRHLLVAAQKNIPVEAILALCKGIMIVIDYLSVQKSSYTMGGGSGRRSGFNTPVHPGSTPKSMDRPVDLSQILGTSDLGVVSDGQEDQMMVDLQQTNQNQDQTSLSDYAQHVLKQICSQEWVLERCLQTSELPNMLEDDMLTLKQVQRLLHMICYPENEYSLIADMDQKSIIVRILENLEQWTLRISKLDLELMYQRTLNSNPDRSNWLDIVARASIEAFQVVENENGKEGKPKNSTWLVAPLISKLPAVQGRILKVAGQVLESTTLFVRSQKESSDDEKKNNSFTGSSGKSAGKNTSSSSSSIANSSSNSLNSTNGKKKITMNNQPFLGLILCCLKGQDDQKEHLLSSLHSQLSTFVQSQSCIDDLRMEEPSARVEMLEELQLRFSLVGGMFDAIQRNSAFITDWAILLTQLITQGVIDLNTNCELFTTVVDMLATLIHSTLLTDTQSDRDENKKSYTTLMKKLKKEIGDKNNTSIKIIRQLLPLYKQVTEVISCEYNTDVKGNKSDIDKKLLRVSTKQRVSVWDILEGHKNPAPLSWSWFGAVKLERKPLTYEEAHRLLKYHTHSLVKPSSYYYEPLPLPPEDIEPLSDKNIDDMKADTPSSIDQSPSAVGVSGRGRGKGTRKPRKPKNAKTPPVNTQQPPQMTQQVLQQQLQNQQQQMHPNHQMGQMHMNMQNQMNPNMNQFGQNQMMQQNQMMSQQQMQMHNQMNMQQQQQQQQMPNQIGGFGPGNSASNVMNHGMNTQQQQQQWGGAGGSGAYNQMNAQQQQAPQQQFYNQQSMPINRYERPQMNNNSKQALSNLLRQRQPPFVGGNQMSNNPANFNMQQQQQRQSGMQPQPGQGQIQNPQQQQFMRNQIRGMAPNQMVPGGPMSGGSVAGNVPGMNSNMVGPNGGMNANQMMMQQNQNMVGSQQQGGQGSAQALNQGMGQGMMNTTGNMGMGQQQGGMMQQGMMGNQSQQQFQNYNNFNNPGINSQQGGGAAGGVPVQQNMMGGNNFNQMNAQSNNQAEYIARQRALQQQQQQQQQNNRGQYINQTPNITMNNMMSQGGAPPYQRQGSAGGGKPNVNQQQQFQQQQRMRQQMMMQGMAQQGGGPVAGPGMGQQQNQNMGQQQSSALVAQLRQIPNQQGMQQYQQHQF